VRGTAAKLLQDDIDFSYSQVFVSDSSEFRRCVWSDAHVSQGFARLEMCISFGTIVDWGTGRLTVFSGEPHDYEVYERALAVPLLIVSGNLEIAGPEEDPRIIEMQSGAYIVFFCQNCFEEHGVDFDVFLLRQQTPVTSSRIIKHDAGLSPPAVLIETAEPIEA